MTEFFHHTFHNGRRRKSRHHVNPSGSEGGIVAASATIGDGVHVAAGAEVGDGVTVGEGVWIGNGAVVSNRAWIGPHAMIGEDALVGDGAWIGAGALIGYRAAVCYMAYIGKKATIGGFASIGKNAVIGDCTPEGQTVWIADQASVSDYASIGPHDWWVTVGPQGSRYAFLTAVWSRVDGLRWWVGCQHGISSDQFKNRIFAQHGGREGGKYMDDYLAVIDFVENHPGLKRARRDANEGAMK